MSASIFNIDDQLPLVDSAQLRLICGSPHNNSWTTYRRLVGIEQRSRLLTLRQAFLVWVTCNLYRNGRRRLTRIKLYEIASSLLSEKPQSFEMLQTLCGTEGIKGENLPQLIADFSGRNVSIRTIYRRCAIHPTTPRFSTGRTYSPAQVRRIIRAVGRRRSKNDRVSA